MFLCCAYLTSVVGEFFVYVVMLNGVSLSLHIRSKDVMYCSSASLSGSCCDELCNSGP